MNNFLLQISSIIIAILALGISIWSWHKSRAIYDIAKYKFPKRVGDSKTDEDRRHEAALREKLRTGNWQILHIYERAETKDELMVVLGRVRQENKVIKWLLGLLAIFIIGVFLFRLLAYMDALNFSDDQQLLIGSVIALKFPIDILGALIGGAIGLLLVLLWDWLSRPKVTFLGFKKIDVNFGILYKLRFKLAGRQNPGICQLEIQWNGKSVKAKWDEAPNPLENDDLSKFKPELVPATFYQPLFLKQEYEVPILHQDDSVFSIFSGWWFGRSNGYGPDPSINNEDEITLVLSGNNFQWRKSFKISEITNAK